MGNRIQKVRRSGRALPRFRLLKRVGVVAFLSVTAAFATAATASADVFSPYIPAQSYPAADCQGRVGPVYDSAGTPSNFTVIGGNQITACRSRHNIQAWVAEYWSAGPNGPWAQVGSTKYTYFANSYGFGSKILETRACGAGYWLTAAYARISGWGDSGWYYSSPHYTNATKCN